MKIAIQKKGKLRHGSVKYLKKRGIEFNADDSRIVIDDESGENQILNLRDDDIAQYVKFGSADIGIVGENTIVEYNVGFDYKKLGFARCRIVIAVPERSGIKKLEDLNFERIATSYPNILSAFLKKKDITSSLIKIMGAVEAAPSLGLADAVCDITQTGKTLEENNLQIIAEVMKSEAVLLGQLDDLT